MLLRWKRAALGESTARTLVFEMSGGEQSRAGRTGREGQGRAEQSREAGGMRRREGGCCLACRDDGETGPMWLLMCTWLRDVQDRLLEI